MRNRQGFTFLEILVVLVILAVLAMIAAPKMAGSYRQNQLGAAARELASSLRLARSTAVAMNDGCEVWLNPETAEYQILPVRLDPDGIPLRSIRGGKRRESAEQYEPSGELTRVRVLPRSVYFTVLHSAAPPREDGLPSILFYPDGSATAACLGLQNTDNLALSIQLYRTTGKVEVKPGDPVLPENATPLFYLPEKVQYAPISRPGG